MQGGEKMRFKLYFNLENPHFPIQYHNSILSFFKKSLSEYSEEYFNKLYHAKDPIMKPYTFAVFFNHTEWKKEEILIENKTFQIELSIADYEIAIAMYNALNKQKNKPFSIHQNSWTLQNISMIMEKTIQSEKIIIKMLSPLVVRSRIDRKDHYYSYGAKEFTEQLKMNIVEQLKITDLPKELVNTFTIEAVQAKKVIIKFYEKKIETSLGTFTISGDKKLLGYLYQAGLGSKRSSRISACSKS
jgi:CRISPR-associated endoribonuclease Cas6